MKLANEDVSMLAFTSEQITVPFLLPEMVSYFFWLIVLLIKGLVLSSPNSALSSRLRELPVC